jgi:hypothetical protein
LVLFIITEKKNYSSKTKFEKNERKSTLMTNQSASSEIGKIRVAVRIRPFLSSENAAENTYLRVHKRHNKISIKIITGDKGYRGSKECTAEKEYTFGNVFPSSSEQASVFVETGVSRLLDSAVEGYNVTVFAYGHTGSGKTYTMCGEGFISTGLNFQRPTNTLDQQYTQIENNSGAKRLGIIPRAILNLYEHIKRKQKENEEWTVRCSHVQLYNENAYDLLNGTSDKGMHTYDESSGLTFGDRRNIYRGMRMRWTAARGFYLQNLVEVTTETSAEAIDLFNHSSKNKICRAHNLNNASSRSHSIFTLIVQRNRDESGELQESRVSFVDLAGSERVAQTGSTGLPLHELVTINKSLHVLRKVIVALSKQKDMKHVPYRDSQLTSLLKHSLGGNCLTLMIACLAPGDQFVADNYSTLQYACHTSRIKNVASINIDPKSKIILQLKKQVHKLQAEVLTRKVSIKNMNLLPKNICEKDVLKDLLQSIALMSTTSVTNRKLMYEIVRLQQNNMELRQTLKMIREQHIMMHSHTSFINEKYF